MRRPRNPVPPNTVTMRSFVAMTQTRQFVPKLLMPVIEEPFRATLRFLRPQVMDGLVRSQILPPFQYVRQELRGFSFLSTPPCAEVAISSPARRSS